MESKLNLTVNGQEVQQSDINLVGKTAALADDRVLAEFVRLPSFGTSVSKAIYPYTDYTKLTATGIANPGEWLVWGTGKITVYPFRAFIGSRTAAGTSGLDNWRDIRSVVFTNSTSLGTDVTFSANSSGNPRWDLVYCAVTPDTNDTNVNRYVKDPVALTVGTQSIAVTQSVHVSLSVVTGTPSATPALPSIPADAAGTYYIPICYVAIQNGFTGTTALTGKNIFCAAPIIGNSSKITGAQVIRPASSLYTAGTNGSIKQANLTTWATNGQRPAWYVSPEAIGGDSLFILMDLSDASTANWSHTNGSVIDLGYKTWLDRYFHWVILLESTTTKFASNPASPEGAPSTTTFLPYAPNDQGTTKIFSGFGQSFGWDQSLGASQPDTTDAGSVFYLTGSNGNGSWTLGAYVDANSGDATFGALKFYMSGTGITSGSFGKLLIKLDALTNPVMTGT